MTSWQWIALAGILAAAVVGFRWAVAYERSFESEKDDA